MVLILIDNSHYYLNYNPYYWPSYDAYIPLTDVKVKGNMIDFVGHVKIQQTFRNLYPRNIEAIYMFNLDSGSTVMGMKMKIGDRILTGKVEAKSEARQTYETAIAEKKTTCLLEKTSNGIYTVNVGNILANEEVQIEIEYITQLECSDDGEMKFVLPTNISPKYDARQKTRTDAIATATTTSAMTFTSSRSTFTFELELQWTSRNSIKEVKSLTNEIRVEGGTDPNTVTIRSETAPSNGDFNVLVTVGEIQPAAYVYEAARGEGEEAESFLMVNHRIRDELAEIEGGDFTILVDRSGSMGSSFDNWSGGAGKASSKTKMDYAKEATRLFVQSLPAGCSFNVVSFGSNYESVFKSSERYNNQTKERALKAIERFGSNLGGTELYQCLSSVLQGSGSGSSSVTKPVINLAKRVWTPGSSSNTASTSAPEKKTKKTEKIVILMTDGDVGNVDAVVGLIRSHRENCRVFTIGIGRDVNRFLCEEVAAASNATCEVMVDNPNISSVVAKMLDAATKSYYKNSTLTVGGGSESGVNRIFVDKPLYANKFLSIYHKLPSRSGVETVQLTSVDGMKNETVQWTLPVTMVRRDDERGQNLQFLPQLYAADQIKSLEKQIVKNRSGGGEGNVALIAEIVRLSVKYGVMNERTSFVVVDERENRGLFALPLPVQVPQYSQAMSSRSSGMKMRKCAALAPSSAASFRSSAGGRGGGLMMQKRESAVSAPMQEERRRNSSVPIKAEVDDCFGEIMMDAELTRYEKMESLNSVDLLTPLSPPPAPPVVAPKRSPSSAPQVSIVENLLTFQNADGSFAYHSASMKTSLFSFDLLRQYAAEQGLSEELAFNVWVLHLLKKEKSASQYVMIVRKLQLWIEKQLKSLVTSGSTLSGLLQMVADKHCVA